MDVEELRTCKELVTPQHSMAVDDLRIVEDALPVKDRPTVKDLATAKDPIIVEHLVAGEILLDVKYPIAIPGILLV